MARALGDEGPEGRGGIVRGLKSFSEETQTLRQGDDNFAESLILNTPTQIRLRNVTCAWVGFNFLTNLYFSPRFKRFHIKVAVSFHGDSSALLGGRPALIFVFARKRPSLPHAMLGYNARC